MKELFKRITPEIRSKMSGEELMEMLCLAMPSQIDYKNNIGFINSTTIERINEFENKMINKYCDTI